SPYASGATLASGQLGTGGAVSPPPSGPKGLYPDNPVAGPSSSYASGPNGLYPNTPVGPVTRGPQGLGSAESPYAPVPRGADTPVVGTGSPFAPRETNWGAKAPAPVAAVPAAPPVVSCGDCAPREVLPGHVDRPSLASCGD